MSRVGSLVFSAPRARYGGDQKHVDVLRRRDRRGIKFERIGRLVWRGFDNAWRFGRLKPNGDWTSDERIDGVGLREAKRLVDWHYGIGDHPK